MKNKSLEQIAAEAWAQPVPENRNPAARKLQKSLARKKIAAQSNTMSKENSKSLPVFLNRNQLAAALGLSVRRLYEARLTPSAFDAKGAPLFYASRISEIANLLQNPKIV